MYITSRLTLCPIGSEIHSCELAVIFSHRLVVRPSRLGLSVFLQANLPRAACYYLLLTGSAPEFPIFGDSNLFMAWPSHREDSGFSAQDFDPSVLRKNSR